MVERAELATGHSGVSFVDGRRPAATPLQATIPGAATGVRGARQPYRERAALSAVFTPFLTPSPGQFALESG
ncbi:MAG: hypothetical protein ACJ8LG_15250 [Massilia sp.]